MRNSPVGIPRVKPILVKLVSALAIGLVVYPLFFSRFSKDEGRVAVSGTITYEGKPLESGIISFTPAEGTDGFAAGGGIKAGKYRISREEGPSTGLYQVQVMVGMPGRFRSEKNPSFQIHGVIVDRKGRHDFDLTPD